ncbi:MAG: alcohol dehydrogenase [Eubacteriaceae bacterium]|nr:alcohol dehydrogenase [Eubacteriaceae bacterium]
MDQTTMKAVVYHGPGDISLDDVPVPQIIEPDDIIVRVTTSTICGTDIHIQHGGLPAVQPGTIIGHEFCGEVVEIGPAVTNVKVGDQCAISCVTSCGQCFYCRRGEYSQCETGSWIFGYLIDGCQAEFVRVPHANMGVYVIPEDLEDEDVLFVGDILSTGFYGAQNAEIKPGDTVAVFGAGPVGMCAMATAKLWGPACIIAVDTNQDRLDVCLREGIADVAFNPATQNVVEEIKKITDARGADCTIEAVGVTPTYEMAINSVRNAGTVSIIGVFEKPQELKMDELWIRNIKIHMGLVKTDQIPALIKLIQTGKLNMRFLQTHSAPLADILEGYDVFGNKKDNCLKWIVK